MCSVLFHYVPFRSWVVVIGGALSEHLWNMNGTFPGQNGTQMEHVPGRRCRREAGGRQAANVLFGVHAFILAH